MAKPTSTGSRRRRLWLAAITAVVAVGIVAALAGGAFADGVQVDNDIATPGLDNSVDLTVAPSATVNTSAQLVISYGGTKHLAASQTVTLHDASAQTDLPAGYSVGDASVSIGTSWADGSMATGTSNISFTAPATPGTYTYTVKWTATKDTDYSCDSSTADNQDCLTGGSAFTINLTVQGSTNHAPVIDTLSPFSGNEGSDINLTATAHDPDAGDTLNYSWAVDTTGGDTGIACPITDSDASTAAASVNCTDDSNGGTFKVTLTVTDNHGASTSQDTTLTVGNVAPSFSTGMPAFAATIVSCASNTVTLNFGYTDPGSNDSQTASIDWGDGNTSHLTAAQTATGSATHTYNSGGPYTATVNVTDDDNGSTGNVSSTNALTVNYNLSSILQPINDTGHGQLPSVFKYGSTIPVKVEVTDCNGAHPSNLALFVTWRTGSSTTPVGDTEVIPTSQPDLGNQMRFSDPLYVLQLNSKKTTSDSSSAVTIWVSIQSTGQSTSAYIGFK